MRDRKSGCCLHGSGIGSRCSGRLQRKLADSSGLTLIEMLCATLVLTLLCVMVSTGISMATYDYRMLTAEAETELLVDTIVSSLTDRLRDSTLRIDAAGNYHHSLGKITIAVGSPGAGIEDEKPAQGTVVIEKTKADGTTEQKALLPDGAYGAVFSKDDTNGKKRRYEVEAVSVFVINSGTESKLPQDLVAGDVPLYPDSGEVVTYTIRVTVKDRITGVSRSTPEDGVLVRCLNPVKKEG